MLALQSAAADNDYLLTEQDISMSEQGTTKDQVSLEAGQACENTDRHLWPIVSKPDDPYESIHVTKEGNIGINVCGNVLVLPLREWHRRAGGNPGRAIGDEQRPSKDQVSQAWDDLNALVAFAYEQGFHEMGYSPLNVIDGALADARRENVRWENAHKILLSENARLQLQLKSERERVEKAAKQILDYQLAGAAPEPPVEWHLIETAPKDCDLLGWFPYHATVQDGGSVWVMRWNADQYAKTPRPYFEASGWVWGKNDQRARQPTHWMRVPTRPSQPPGAGQ